MARLCTITVDFDGDLMRYGWAIPAEAHSIGLAGTRRTFKYGMGDDLGTAEGAQQVEHALVDMAHEVAGQVWRAWRQQGSLF